MAAHAGCPCRTTREYGAEDHKAVSTLRRYRHRRRDGLYSFLERFQFYGRLQSVVDTDQGKDMESDTEKILHEQKDQPVECVEDHADDVDPGVPPRRKKSKEHEKTGDQQVEDKPHDLQDKARLRGRLLRDTHRDSVDQLGDAESDDKAPLGANEDDDGVDDRQPGDPMEPGGSGFMLRLELENLRD